MSIRRRLKPGLCAIIAGVFLFASSAWAAPKVRFDGHKLVEVNITSQADLEKTLSISPDIWSERPGVGPMLFRVAPGDPARLDQAGLTYRVVRDNIQSLIDAEEAHLQATGLMRAAGVFFADYQPFATVDAYLDTLVALRPDLASIFTVGVTLEGRTVRGIRITGATAGPKQGVLLNGCQHAREWITVASTSYIADQLIRNYDTDPQIKTLVDQLEFYIVPVVNADGYVYTWTTNRLWRKNRRNNGDGTFGVDPNRNWSFQWGGTGSSGATSSEIYRGPTPFSEPCTVNMRDFVLATPNLVAHFDIHSFSQLVLGAWAYTNTPAPMASIANPIGQGVADAMTSVNGLSYLFGTGAFQVGLASGVMPDWTFGNQGLLSWTLELRDTGQFGFVLPAAQIIPSAEETLAGVKSLAQSVLLPFEIRFPNGLPTTVAPGALTTVQVEMAPITGALAAGSALQFARVGSTGAFTQTALTSLGGNLFQGQLPAAACGQTIEFYYEGTSTGGAVIRSPAGAPATVHMAQALLSTLVFSDDFESDLGWTVGDPSDTATSGLWVRVDPVGTAAQPENDHSAAGTLCYVTGQGAVGGSLGANDVDGGATTLLSPVLDATAMTGDPFISYYRWYSNNTGGNPNTESMPIDISNDDGATWVALESAVDNASAWVFKEWRIADFVTPSNQIRLRFVARDLTSNGGAIVEAGVDDVQLSFRGCNGGPDLNSDGQVGSSDLAVLLGTWGPCPPAPASCLADLDGDGQVGASDLAVMLGSWGPVVP